MMNVEPRAAELIRRWDDELSQPVFVGLARSADERSSVLQAFLEAFTRLARKVRLSFHEGLEDELPAILIGTSIRWQALPEGGELMPFLRAVEMHSSPDLASTSVPESLKSHIESVELRADLKIYVSPQCPFCPDVLSEMLPLACLNPMIHLTVTDGVLFPELARDDGVRSVPTIILDGVFRWTGAGNRNEIVKAILNRDPTRLNARSIEDFIKDGNAEDLARMMMDRGRIFPAFMDVLESQDWSTRLGAMVVVEEIAEKNPELLEKILDELWNRLPRVSGPARGDAMSLFGLGQSRSKLWIDRLQGILEQEDEEVREAISEVLDKLRLHQHIQS